MTLAIETSLQKNQIVSCSCSCKLSYVLAVYSAGTGVHILLIELEYADQMTFCGMVQNEVLQSNSINTGQYTGLNCACVGLIPTSTAVDSLLCGNERLFLAAIRCKHYTT